MAKPEPNMRGIPPVHRFLSDPRIAAFEALQGKQPVKDVVTQTLDAVRRAQANGAIPPFEALRSVVLEKLERAQYETLLPVINATGVLLHTNLGRAPIARSALDAMVRIGSGYSNLEYDVPEGRRGSRYDRAGALLRAVTGAEDALVVNNCAAGVLLLLDTFAKGREVIVSRNQLVEIGGGFRLPDVLERTGADLVEVGATNKVYLADFERALSPRTALLLRSHTSNYRITGFTHEVEPKELARLARRAGIPIAEDLGSGALVDLAEYGLPHERTVQEAIADGIDLVTFSGDKVLGGPQAGIVAGRASLIARLRSNPLIRALRVDKLTFAALIETLRLYANPARRSEIPFFAMLGASLETLRGRAGRYRDSVSGARIVESQAYAGGGTLPESGIPSVAIALQPACGAQTAAERLRRAPVPIVARIEDGRLLLDLRSIAPEEDDAAIAALQETLST
jgi:L-seryl-tRNA(Ser) seleniumtransferase